MWWEEMTPLQMLQPSCWIFIGCGSLYFYHPLKILKSVWHRHNYPCIIMQNSLKCCDPVPAVMSSIHTQCDLSSFQMCSLSFALKVLVSSLQMHTPFSCAQFQCLIVATDMEQGLHYNLTILWGLENLLFSLRCNL